VSAPHHLFVCTSCRVAGETNQQGTPRSGSVLFENLAERYANWARRESFVILPYECLSVCKRACGFAFRAPGKFTYVFGDAKPRETESAIIECAKLYRHAATGFLAREERPPALRAGILARVPPVETP